MLSDVTTIVSWRARPRSFVALMSLYESNYLRLASLAGDLRNLRDVYVSRVPDDCDLRLSVTERSPYTTSVDLTYLFREGEEVRTGLGLLDVVAEGAMRVRAKLNQADLAGLSVGQPAQITLDAYPSRRYTGRLERLSPVATPGLSDGGAHCTQICDVSAPTTLLAYWGRDRRLGATLPLEMLVRRQTADTARLAGLGDRGVLAPGRRADLNVIDWSRLGVARPEFLADFPAGGRRLVQRATGYRTTLVAGEPVFVEGEHTGALPGRVVRRKAN